MANLYITEYAAIAFLGGAGGVLVPREPPVAEQKVDFSGGAAASAAFNSSTRFIRISSDAVCSVLVGSNPTATTSSGRLAAGVNEYRSVTAGHKISAISNT